MKYLLGIAAVLGLAGTASGATPCSVEFGRVTNYLGVLSGSAEITDRQPVYITVRNGGLSYTTLTDEAGQWTITFRYFSSNVEAYAWLPDQEKTVCSDRLKGPLEPQ